MPRAPAATCSLASVGLLCVLMWGRLATPLASHSRCTRAMLASTRSRSITTAGVPNSRATCVLSASLLIVGSLLGLPRTIEPRGRAYNLRGGQGGVAAKPDDRFKRRIAHNAPQRKVLESIRETPMSTPKPHSTWPRMSGVREDGLRLKQEEELEPDAATSRDRFGSKCAARGAARMTGTGRS